MSWSIEIKDADGIWHGVHPNLPNAEPAEFKTAKEARTILEFCYPQQVAKQRAGGETIVKIRNNRTAFQGG
jgi:hypothetical protein